MPAIIPSLSAPPSGVRPQPPQTAASVTPGTQAASQALVIPQAIPQAIPLAPPQATPQAIPPAAMRMETPVWPLPGTLNLPTELLDLGETQITHTATTALPETAPDFWDMLATALPGDG